MAENPNIHVENYLDAYISMEFSPFFAVMLDGAWGSGKTFIAERLTNDVKSRNYSVVYVSLYGVSCRDDFDVAVIQSLHPFFGSSYTQIGGRIAFTAFQYFGGPKDIDVKKFIKTTSADVYIFDDFERANLSSGELLGHINEFIEHEGKKAIVLANQAEIHEEEYNKIKEKTIGKTLSVFPDYENAFDNFIDKIHDCCTRDIVSENRSVIKEILSKSAYGNLRIVEYCLWEYQRLIITLKKLNIYEEGACSHILKVLFPILFEFRGGKLDIEEIQDRTFNIAISHIGNDNSSTLAKCDEKYPNIFLADDILSDDFLYNFVKNGFIDQEELKRCMRRSPYLNRGENEPAWRTLWHLVDRDDETLERALNTFDYEFQNRSAHDPGVILHFFGLRLWLADEGFLSGSRAEIVTECEEYIEYIVRYVEFDEHIEKFVRDPLSAEAYDGLGFMLSDSYEFLFLRGLLIGRLYGELWKSFPEKGEIAHSLLKEDPNAFLREVTVSTEGKARYAKIPILKEIDIHTFAESFVGLSIEGQKEILKALYLRYGYEAKSTYLSSEIGWIDDVKQVMKDELGKLPRFSKKRLEILVDHYLHPITEKTD